MVGRIAAIFLGVVDRGVTSGELLRVENPIDSRPFSDAFKSTKTSLVGLSVWMNDPVTVDELCASVVWAIDKCCVGLSVFGRIKIPSDDEGEFSLDRLPLLAHKFG